MHNGNPVVQGAEPTGRYFFFLVLCRLLTRDDGTLEAVLVDAPATVGAGSGFRPRHKFRTSEAFVCKSDWRGTRTGGAMTGVGVAAPTLEGADPLSGCNAGKRPAGGADRVPDESLGDCTAEPIAAGGTAT